MHRASAANTLRQLWVHPPGDFLGLCFQQWELLKQRQCGHWKLLAFVPSWPPWKRHLFICSSAAPTSSLCSWLPAGLFLSPWPFGSEGASHFICASGTRGLSVQRGRRGRLCGETRATRCCPGPSGGKGLGGIPVPGSISKGRTNRIGFLDKTRRSSAWKATWGCRREEGSGPDVGTWATVTRASFRAGATVT